MVIPPMTTIEFLKRKNKIVFDVTGVQLVPDNQLIDLPYIKLSSDFCEEEDGLDLSLHAKICPYCETYREKPDGTKYTRIDCTKCIMEHKGNGCFMGETDSGLDSTWNQCYNLWDDDATKEDVLKLIDLVNTYNKEGQDAQNKQTRED